LLLSHYFLNVTLSGRPIRINLCTDFTAHFAVYRWFFAAFNANSGCLSVLVSFRHFFTTYFRVFGNSPLDLRQSKSGQ